jgi:hypothetical protein
MIEEDTPSLDLNLVTHCRRVRHVSRLCSGDIVELDMVTSKEPFDRAVFDGKWRFDDMVDAHVAWRITLV